MYLVSSFVKFYSAEIILGLALLSLIILGYVISLSVRFSRFIKGRNAKLDSGQVGDIVDYIREQSDLLVNIQGRLRDISVKQDEQSITIDSCLQNVGLVRFNAFEDVGGEQSFALALLDARKNGVIISSLYGRHDSRCYIKGIKNGAGERTLSDEEKRALQAALE